MDQSGDPVINETEFDQFMQRLADQLTKLSPVEVLGSVRENNESQVFPIFWQILTRNNIKDLVWKNASEEIAGLNRSAVGRYSGNLNVIAAGN